MGPVLRIEDCMFCDRNIGDCKNGNCQNCESSDGCDGKVVLSSSVCSWCEPRFMSSVCEKHEFIEILMIEFQVSIPAFLAALAKSGQCHYDPSKERRIFTRESTDPRLVRALDLNASLLTNPANMLFSK